MSVRDEDPPNALLTAKQRQRLTKDGEEIPDEIRWKMHSRIRERLVNTIYDFAILLEHWDELNLGKVFDYGEMDPREKSAGSEGMLYTLYRGHYSGTGSFEDSLAKAVTRAERDMNNNQTQVIFKVKEYEWGQNMFLPGLAKRVDSGDIDSLRVSEMRALLNHLSEKDTSFDEMMQSGEALAELSQKSGDDE
jgi:hypothetical protein